MQYEAARVTREVSGKDKPEAPQRFTTYQQAVNYIQGTPVSDDGVRPWVRNTEMQHDAFLVIGGKHLWMPIDANHYSNGGCHGQIQ